MADEEKMFLFSSEEPWGSTKNFSCVRGVGADKIIQVKIPTNKFNSGDETRDEDVSLLLKGDKQQEMSFVSEPISEDTWKALIQGQQKLISGKLNIGGNDFDVTFASHIKDKSGKKGLEGRFAGKFSVLNLRLQAWPEESWLK